MKARKKRSLRDALSDAGHDKPEGLVLAGLVFVNGERAVSPAAMLSADDKLEVRGKKEYVSRSAAKLAGAFQQLEPGGGEHVPGAGFSVVDRVSMDLGASTGGFTQVLLSQGVGRVYAVDVGYGILDYGLRSDPRVVAMDRTDARAVSRDWFLPSDWEEITATGLFVTCDVSFLSLRSVIRPLAIFARLEGISFEGFFLLKPQFEDSKATEGGILRDPVLRERIVQDFLEFARGLGLEILGYREAALKGSSGNQEYLVWLRRAVSPAHP